MSEFTINIRVEGDVGTLEWSGAATQELLDDAVSRAADEALLGHDLRRVEVSVPDFDRMAVRALHRAGFRREGRRRQGFRAPDGKFADVLVYGRLATDSVYAPDTFSAVMDTVLATKRVIGHVLFTDADGRVLLLETAYKSDWELPGGIIERGEDPRLGATRELVEEIGLEVELGDPALVDWMPPYLGWSDAIEFLYVGGVIDHSQVVVPDSEAEIHRAHWVAPSDVPARVTPLSARRIALLLAGRRGFSIDGRLPD